jgi:vancomycin resistance protein YoaR
MKACLTLLALGLSMTLGAEELSHFNCQRPAPLEQGSVTNAGIACELVNGIVLKPGEVFSFNKAMTAGLDRFVDGTAYASGRVIRSEGGGICQVSAALYNAALLAGLEVEERHSHSIYDPLAAYVPAGQDSAISRSVGADMRFTNSTAAPLALSVTAHDGEVDVVLLGHQRHPRQRWISTKEMGRDAHGVRERLDPSLAAGTRVLQQKGFDGLHISRQLCKAGPEGLTECAALGTDDYMEMDEVWRVGPAAASALTAPEAQP